MKINDLLSIIEQTGIYPSKKLGQNFLIDENLLNFIAKTADVKKDENIIEIGPGLGSLTERILESEAMLTAIEFDHKLFDYLKFKYKSRENITLINEDACRTDYTKLTANIPEYRLISNLPYSISTPLMAKFADLENPPAGMLLLLQKETALRFIATPNTKDYGSITIRLQLLYQGELVRTVSPNVFFPKPDVQSAILKLTRKTVYPDISARKKVDAIVKTAFLKRRKKLKNTIAPLFGERAIEKAFSEMGLNPNARPEDISPQDYLILSSYLPVLAASN
ncbi:MAG TPA: ribosomal RNA small subunit methyltransferase A [Lentisphaeria bacterium]|nr:MAG: ribosomal RNA small subunit methyltransferase A [Lentisphaerae bacterium GWF2_38_69]HBM16217.1 ribosomal RNA small subunit methyltransferase A [Lentisphaeria bacterium]